MRPPLRSALGDLQLAFAGAWPAQQLLERLGRVPTSVLEVGCGSGKLSLHLALQGASSVVLLDYDEDMVDYAGKLAQAAQLLINASLGPEADKARLPVVAQPGDGHNLALPSDSFELVWSEGVLEHFPREEQVRMLQEQARVSKAYVCFVVPDAAHPESQRIAREVHHHYAGMPEHETPLSKQTCEGLAKEAGLEVLVLEPCMERFHFVLCRKPGAPDLPSKPSAAAAPPPVPVPPAARRAEAESPLMHYLEDAGTLPSWRP